MSAARDLFKQVTDGGYDLIVKIVPDKWQENPILDFKRAAKDSAPMTDEDRKSLAKELSAFANSDGGVIIWEIYAASSSSGDPDVAQREHPIANLDHFVSDLQRYTPQVVSPGIIGVEHYPIKGRADPTKGYVITYVPRSEGDPHMARGKDQHRFFFRSGSSSLTMEPFMLADRYRRRPQPKLELTSDIVCHGSRDEYVIDLIVGMRNIGLGIAVYPALVLYGCSFFGFNPHGIDSGGRYGLPMRPARQDQRSCMFAGGVNEVIHPGTRCDVVRFQCTTPTKDLNLIPQMVSVKYELYCEGFCNLGEEMIPVRSSLESSLRT